MIINKAYKFRMYPNDNQKEIINKTFGCTRFVYNYYLDKRINLYKNESKNIKMYDLIKDIPNLYVERPYLKEIDSMSLRCSIFDLENSYQKYLCEKIGFLKFKNKFSRNSYRTNYIKTEYKGKIYENIKLDLKSKTITLPKLKEVKIKGYRKLNKISGRIISATVAKELDNTYYVSVVVEENIVTPVFTPTKIVGIDLGINDLIITSNYEKYKNEQVIKKYEKRIKQKQKRLSKKEKGSKNYYKLKQLIARLYKKIKNARIYIIHKITKEITDNNDIIVTETLKIKNMLKKHHISKSLMDASLSEIIRQLEYKCRWKNKKMYKIDTYYPSSQICLKMWI